MSDTALAAELLAEVKRLDEAEPSIVDLGKRLSAEDREWLIDHGAQWLLWMYPRPSRPPSWRVARARRRGGMR